MWRPTSQKERPVVRKIQTKIASISLIKMTFNFGEVFPSWSFLMYLPERKRIKKVSENLEHPCYVYATFESLVDLTSKI